MSDGVAEACAAARWWTERFADRDGATAVIDGQVVAVQVPSEAQVAVFESFLVKALLELIRSPEWAWPTPRQVDSDDQRPFRTVATGEFGADEVLVAAMEAAGYEEAGGVVFLPTRTVMWVDPGEVTVTEGGPMSVETVPLPQ